MLAAACWSSTHFCRLNPHVWLSNPIFWIKGPTIGLLHAIFWDVSYRMPRLKLSQVPGLVGVAKYVYAWICSHSSTSFLFRRLGSDNMCCIHVFQAWSRPIIVFEGISTFCTLPCASFGLTRPHPVSICFLQSSFPRRPTLQMQKFTLLIPNLGL